MLFSSQRKCCLLILGISLLIIVQLRFPGNTAAQISREQAIVILYAKVIGPSTVWAYASKDLVTDTTKIKSLFTVIVSPYKKSWFFFVDDWPAESWDHPCRYVFIDYATGADTLFHHSRPPSDMSLVELLKDPRRFLELSYQIIASFRSPGPNPQDMAWDGQYLWVADDSTDFIYQLDPLNGSIISSFPSPGPEPRGLTWDGTYLWCSDSDSMRIFRLNKSNGLVISSIPAPVSGLPNALYNQIRGLAWDGVYLWSAYADNYYSSSKVYQVDPADGRIIDYFAGCAEGLVFENGYLWKVIFYGYIDRLSVLSSELEDIYFCDTPGDYPKNCPTGLTFDGTYFWLADAAKDTIYQLELASNAVESSNETLPTSFRLDQNYPNPFNSATLIGYELPEAARVTIKIYNLMGQEIVTLINESRAAGQYLLHWDGKNALGTNVASGIYVCRMVAVNDNTRQQFIMSRKLALVR